MPGAAEWIDAPSEEEGAMYEKGEGRQKGQEFRSIFLEISRLSVKAYLFFLAAPGNISCLTSSLKVRLELAS